MSPDHRQHRGAHPEDERLFSPAQLPTLRAAVGDLSWLLSRGYAVNSSLKIVGDRYTLSERQRLAIARAACADASREKRNATRLPVEAMLGQDVIIDGFNLIITVEAALGGGALLLCRDGCLRDLASVHGSYKAVMETENALCLLGEDLERCRPRSVLWLLDKPISNSGRLAERIREIADLRSWRWSVEVVFDPDKAILASERIAITSDSTILDGVARWVNFNVGVVERHLPNAWIIDLRDGLNEGGTFMPTLPEEIAAACAPLFAAVPFDRAMGRLLGSHPQQTELVETILRDPALANRPDLAAGLWLYVDNLERSHTVSQSLETPTGSYWHGIMHRREGDFSNSRYWMRRAAGHPLRKSRSDLDPEVLIRQVESANGKDDPVLVTRQREEWQALFEWCAANR
jgi:hypothetical protein